eukprot:s3641_g12.t1
MERPASATRLVFEKGDNCERMSDSTPPGSTPASACMMRFRSRSEPVPCTKAEVQKPRGVKGQLIVTLDLDMSSSEQINSQFGSRELGFNN